MNDTLEARSTMFLVLVIASILTLMTLGLNILNPGSSQNVDSVGLAIGPNGQTIIKGCVDSDSRNYFVNGSAIFSSDANNYCVYSDFCQGTRVREYYCYNNTLRYIYYNCTNGCLNGRCNNISQPQCYGDNQCRELVCTGGSYVHERCIGGRCILQTQCPNITRFCTPGTVQSSTVCNVCNSLGSAYVQNSSRCPSGRSCNPLGQCVQPTPPPNPGSGTQWYASPNGLAAGTGSMTSPWNIQTALSGANGRVHPGDTIWLRGGSYQAPAGTDSFQATLVGTSSDPIKVRQYPGERAILDVNPGDARANSIGYTALTISGAYTWYWGFEVGNSDTSRINMDIGNDRANLDTSPYSKFMVGGIGLGGDHNRLINLQVHDQGSSGISNQAGATNSDTYGVLSYYNGRVLLENAYAYGMYTQNVAPSIKNNEDNFWFNNFGNFQLHVYGSSAARLDNYNFYRNTVFSTVAYADSGEQTYWIHYGGRDEGAIGNNDRIDSNYLYKATINYGLFTSSSITNNILMRSSISSDSTQVSGSESFSGNGGTPSTPRIIINPARSPYNDAYEPRRGNVIVFTNGNIPTVSIDLSSLLSQGDQYEIRDVQNYWGTPVASGSYNGGSVSVTLPTTGSPITRPAVLPTARAVRNPTHTNREFNAFIVIKKNIAMP